MRGATAGAWAHACGRVGCAFSYSFFLAVSLSAALVLAWPASACAASPCFRCVLPGDRPVHGDSCGRGGPHSGDGAEEDGTFVLSLSAGGCPEVPLVCIWNVVRTPTTRTNMQQHSYSVVHTGRGRRRWRPVLCRRPRRFPSQQVRRARWCPPRGRPLEHRAPPGARAGAPTAGVLTQCPPSVVREPAVKVLLLNRKAGNGAVPVYGERPHRPSRTAVRAHLLGGDPMKELRKGTVGCRTTAPSAGRRCRRCHNNSAGRLGQGQAWGRGGNHDRHGWCRWQPRRRRRLPTPRGRGCACRRRRPTGGNGLTSTPMGAGVRRPSWMSAVFYSYWEEGGGGWCVMPPPHRRCLSAPAGAARGGGHARERRRDAATFHRPPA